MTRLFSMIAFAVVVALAANATTPTQVQNVDDPTLHAYQEYASASCGGIGDCAVLFPAITTGRTLVQHASCDFGLSSGGILAVAYLDIQGLNPRNTLPLFAFGTADGTKTYGINADTFLFYTKGQQPRVDVISSSGTVSSLECTLSGYYN
jgi:hypothetical protein